MDDSLIKSVDRLRKELAQGPQPGETSAALAERLLSRFEVLLHRAHRRQIEIRTGVKGAAGRPPTGVSRPKSADRPGRKKRFSPADEREILRELDALKSAYARGTLCELDREDAMGQGDTLSDKGALRLWALRTYTERLMADGRSRADARKEARVVVRGLGTLLKTHQVRISRLRSRNRRKRV